MHVSETPEDMVADAPIPQSVKQNPENSDSARENSDNAREKSDNARENSDITTREQSKRKERHYPLEATDIVEMKLESDDLIADNRIDNLINENDEVSKRPNKTKEQKPSPPKFKKDMNALVLKPSGNTATLRCAAEGKPLKITSSVLW